MGSLLMMAIQGVKYIQIILYWLSSTMSQQSVVLLLLRYVLHLILSLVIRSKYDVCTLVHLNYCYFIE